MPGGEVIPSSRGDRFCISASSGRIYLPARPRGFISDRRSISRSPSFFSCRRPRWMRLEEGVARVDARASFWCERGGVGFEVMLSDIRYFVL